MGNRAVITTAAEPNIGECEEIGVYLHWNGGRASVEAFLMYCKMQGYRAPESDNYGWARLCQVIGNFFGGKHSIGIDKCCNLDCDNYDNGVYIIKDWQIVGRQYFAGEEQNDYNILEFLFEIDRSMPIKEMLGRKEIKRLYKKYSEEDGIHCE